MNWHRKNPSLYYFVKKITGSIPKLKHYKKIKSELDEIEEGNGTFLIATNTGGNIALLSFDLLLGIGLRSRGKKVKFVLCDGALSACQMCEISTFPERFFPNRGLNQGLCKTCFYPAQDIIKKLGFEVILLSNYRCTNQIEQIDRKRLLEHSRSGFLRYLAHGDFENQKKNKPKLNDQFVAANEFVFSAYLEIIKHEKPECVILHHGVYVPQGSALEAIKKTQTRCVTWCPSYRKCTVMLSNGDSYHRTMPQETDEAFLSINWSDKHEQLIKSYLISRSYGTNDWITFSKRTNKNINIREELDIPESASVYLVLTNVVWDANTHFEHKLFESMLDWLVKTIEIFATMPHKHAIVRVHPAEILGTIKSNQLVVDELKKTIKQLPQNVHIVKPENKRIDTYSIIEEADIAIVYGTKAAIEIAAKGKPVIVAGGAWAGGKNFTIDPKTLCEYEHILREPTDTHEMTETRKLKAIKYAYYFFFLRMIEIKSIKKAKFFAPFTIREDIGGLSDIQNDTYLQHVLDSIINGAEFIYEDAT